MGFSEDIGSSSEHRLENGVVVYTSEGCPRCNMLKRWLENKDTNFEERNLADSDVMTDLVMRNFVVLSAPAIEIKGNVYTEKQIFENNGLIKSSFSEVFEAL